MGFEQGGNHNDAICAGVDDLLEIVDVDSADAENRNANIEMHLFDVAETDWLVIGFGWRSEDRSIKTL